MVRNIFSKNSEEKNQLSEEIGKLRREVKKNIREGNEQKEEFEKLNLEVKSILADQKEINKTIKINSEILNKTIAELALFKPQIEKKLLRETTQVIEKELGQVVNTIDAQASGFSQAKEILNKHLTKSKELFVEQEKIKTLISSIKAKDFELEKYAKELNKNDKNKLEMMKRIDELETMMARMKRRK